VRRLSLYLRLLRVRLIHRDVLQVPLEEVTDDPSRLKVIGNIPYNITTSRTTRRASRSRTSARCAT
jgi:16S rRNA A1518/A1519 N6-dimethyltransferase RsmA/KsgA/DIM1 with predicted DNA glycosylase/AP lyase activity